MTVELTSSRSDCGIPVSGLRIIIVASVVCAVLSIIALLWLAATSQSHADALRPLRVDEQRMGNRHARLSNSDNLARLARLGGTVEDLRLDLLEAIERSRTAAGVYALQAEYQDVDGKYSPDLEGAEATTLRLTIDSTVMHESVLLDLFSILEAAVGAWPLRIQGCAIARGESDTSTSALPPIRARCVLEIMHWFWPDSQPPSPRQSTLPTPWGMEELKDQRLFFSSREREALNQKADVEGKGLRALANAAFAEADRNVVPAAESASGNLPSRKETGSTDLTVADDSIRGERKSRRVRKPVPSIVFGGVIRGTSSTIALLNGVPCPVKLDGQISSSCGLPKSSAQKDSMIDTVWVEKRTADVSRGLRLRVVYADGHESSLSIGERTPLVQ